MRKRLILNDIRKNRLFTAATVAFMTVSAMLFALTVLLSVSLLSSIQTLMEQAETPDFLQMHAGTVKEEEISAFAEAHPEVEDRQVMPFLNLENSKISLGEHSLADSTQDNGLSVQGQSFDYLVDLTNELPKVWPGEVFVPICYRAQYELVPGDVMQIGNRKFTIAGFIRDSQMNSMMASSKRFLVNEADYESMQKEGTEEYLIEFRLHEGTDTGVFENAYKETGLPDNGPAVTKPLIRMMNALSDGMMIFVILLVSVVAVIISVICIRFLLLTRMEKERKEMGMLRAIGMAKGQIRGLWFAKYVALSAAGALIGLLLTGLAQKPLTAQMQELYGGVAIGGWTIFGAVLAVLLAEGILLLAIRRILKRMEKLPVLSCLYDVPEQKKGREYRSYFLIAAVAAACAFLMLVPANLYHTLDSPEFVTYMGIGDAGLRMDIRQTDDIAGVTARTAEQLAGDADVEKYVVLKTRSYSMGLPDGSTSALTVEEGDHNVFPVRYEKGEAPKGKGQIALSALNAKETGLTVGDSLSLNTEKGAERYTVCGIYSDITNGGKTAKACRIADEKAPVMWSVFYVSLKDHVSEKTWINKYQQPEIKVTDIADYVKGTYGQTLKEIRLAAVVATGISAGILFVVTALFLRLTIEKNRYAISLKKAIGFCSRDIKRSYRIRGFLPAFFGIVTGIFLGNTCGEKLCGSMLTSFGAEGFSFVTDWRMVCFLIPVTLSFAAAAAVEAGIWEIRNIRAFECCIGKE